MIKDIELNIRQREKLLLIISNEEESAENSEDNQVRLKRLASDQHLLVKRKMFSLTGMIPALKQSEVRRRSKKERAILREQVRILLFKLYCAI